MLVCTILVLGLVQTPTSFWFSTLLQACTSDAGPGSSAIGIATWDVDGASCEEHKI